MAAKLRQYGSRLCFLCPGCEDVHQVHTGPNGWTWDGSVDLPTISPSVLVRGVQWPVGEGFHKPRHTVAAGGQIVCHSFVRAGRIEFLGDSTHALAGQTADLPDYEWPA